MNIQKGSIIKLLFCNMVFLLVFFISSGFASTDSDKKSLTDNHIRSMITDYKNRIISNQIEVLEIKKDLEWLNCKIQKINYSNHTVSGDIQTSLHYKTSRIFALEKKIEYCSERLRHFKSQIRVLDPPPVKICFYLLSSLSTQCLIIKIKRKQCA